MRVGIRDIFRLVRRHRGVGQDTRRLPSLVKAMAILVPRSVMREVVASSHDRRQWGVLAAAWVGVSEREFMSTAARELGMPYLDHVAVPDVTLLGSQTRSILNGLRKIGAIVQLQGDRIVGFVAADPAEVRGLALYDGTQNVSMAPWTEIAKALDSAERLVAESESNVDRAEALRRRELTERVIEILVNEAARHGASNLEILSSEGKNRYQFTTPEGKVAVGNIHQEALQSVLVYLNSVEEDSLSCKDVGRVLVRRLGSSSNLRLSWSTQARPPHESPRLLQECSRSEGLPIVTADRVAHIAGSLEVQDRATAVPILVVDDNPMFCRVLERLLVRDGFEVSFSENGEDALDKLTSLLGFLPRVIICDLHMPKMNGKEFVRSIKEDPRLKNIPVVMLTSDEGVDAEIAILELGADTLISKSKDPRVLCAHVTRLSKAYALREAA